MFDWHDQLFPSVNFLIEYKIYVYAKFQESKWLIFKWVKSLRWLTLKCII